MGLDGEQVTDVNSRTRPVRGIFRGVALTIALVLLTPTTAFATFSENSTWYWYLNGNMQWSGYCEGLDAVYGGYYYEDHNEIYTPGNRTWLDEGTLTRHVREHGEDFGISSEYEYARAANYLFRRAVQNSPEIYVKQDADGIIRIWDFVNNIFGVFSKDGRTITFYKLSPTRHLFPTNEDYWDAQPGFDPR